MLHRSTLCLILAPVLLLSACASQPKPQPLPTVSPFITKPINKANDTKTNFEKTGKAHEKLDPEKETGQ
jgi:PBP1b-binding outer membrane lipoprotein LpoB